MTNAEKILRLTFDPEPMSLFGIGTEELTGAMVFCSNIRKHFNKHIDSFNGLTFFNSITGTMQIEKLLNMKTTYFMRRFDNPLERLGAERMHKHIKVKFNKITKE